MSKYRRKPPSNQIVYSYYWAIPDTSSFVYRQLDYCMGCVQIRLTSYRKLDYLAVYS